MITDEYGLVYEEIDDFVLETRNDFTVEEIQEVINNAEELMVNYVYPINPDSDENGYSKTKTYGSEYPEQHLPGTRNYNSPTYVGKRLSSREADPIGVALREVEDFVYEGGIIQGFGTFETSEHGNLGDGHEAWIIVKHVESGRIFRVEGWYSSHDSGEMDTWVEVETCEQTVVRYKPLGRPDAEAFENPSTTKV